MSKESFENLILDLMDLQVFGEGVAKTLVGREFLDMAARIEFLIFSNDKLSDEQKKGFLERLNFAANDNLSQLISESASYMESGETGHFIDRPVAPLLQELPALRM